MDIYKFMDADSFYNDYKHGLDRFVSKSIVFDEDAKITVDLYSQKYKETIKMLSEAIKSNAKALPKEKQYYYDKFFNISEAMEAKIENIKEVITHKLTEIIENAKTAQNSINTLNMDKEINNFRRYLNKQQISTFAQKALVEVPPDVAASLTGADAAIYHQLSALAGDKSKINEYYPNGGPKGGTINKKYRKRLTRRKYKKSKCRRVRI